MPRFPNQSIAQTDQQQAQDLSKQTRKALNKSTSSKMEAEKANREGLYLRRIQMQSRKERERESDCAKLLRCGLMCDGREIERFYTLGFFTYFIAVATSKFPSKMWVFSVFAILSQ